MIKRFFFIHFCFFCSFFFLFLTPASAQVTFQNTIGGTGDDGANSVQQTTDGGYIITGQTYSFTAGASDVYLVKKDPNGNTMWTKTFGGTGDDGASSVQQTTDGGYIIVGTTRSFGAGKGDIYLIKTDMYGNSLWTKTFGGLQEECGTSVQQTYDGGYIVTGYTVSFAAGGDTDVYLIKTDANGNAGPGLGWTKTFGGIGPDGGTSVLQVLIPGGYGYIVAGYTGPWSNIDAYLLQTDNVGNKMWEKTFGDSGDDGAVSIQRTSDGGYIMAGRMASFATGDYDVYLIKTHSDGSLDWSNTYGGTGNDIGYSVRETTGGGYIIAGITNSFGAGVDDVYLIKTDIDGNLLWEKTFGGTGNEVGWSVRQTADGYIIAGNTNSFGAGSHDVYLIKTDDIGNSGCNTGSPSTVVTPVTQENIPISVVSFGTFENNPIPVVGSGGTSNTLCTSVVGIHELTTDDAFSIFPNPTTDIFTITFDDTINEGKVEIFDRLGKRIFAHDINNDLMEINLESFANGIYLVKVSDGEKYYNKKIVINKRD